MLELKNAQKTYLKGTQNEIQAISSVSLNILDGEFVTFLGPSGCGKTTLLRVLAGFEALDEGTVMLDGRELSGAPETRPFHMVFQKYALFPHLSVRDNVAFSLRLKRVEDREVEARVQASLEQVRLAGFESRNPSTLSGGQAQRVALARALINRPRMLFLDEPLSALDLKLRLEMRSELKRLQKESKTTFILVTHDQEEALSLSDRIFLFHSGKLEQSGSPEELYSRPTTRTTADFIGRVSKLPRAFLESHSPGILKGIPELKDSTGGEVWIRPEAFIESSQGIDSKIIHREFHGSHVECVLEAEGFYFRCRTRHVSGASMRVGIDPRAGGVWLA